MNAKRPGGVVLRGKNPGEPGREPRVALSYLQLVEVAFVATFRDLKISLRKIHAAREYAATVLQAEYPFATLRWQSEGAHFLLSLTDFADPDAPETQQLIIADANGQTAWGGLMKERFFQFDYVDDLALIWHPRGRIQPVTIDPRIAFGAPTVDGLPTWVIKGRYEAGQDLEEITDDFDISEKQARDALMFEDIDVPSEAA